MPCRLARYAARPHRRAFLATGMAAVAAAATSVQASGALAITDLIGPSGEITASARAMEGARVTLRGYFAPALRPRPDKVLLTESSSAPCGLCGAPHDPGASLVVVFAEGASPETPPELAQVSGVVRLGPIADPDSGRVAPLALIDAVLRAG